MVITAHIDRFALCVNHLVAEEHQSCYGQHFDQRAKLTQYQTSLSSFTSPFPSFRQTSGYTDFHAAMVTIAQEIEAQLAQVPPWEGDWPIELPKPGPPDPMGLPQL